MQAMCRVFAREYNGSTLTIGADPTGSPGAVVTPGGAWCVRLFLAGALTEVEDRQGSGVHARVADPTGTFELRCGPKNADAAQALLGIEAPAFVTVVGEAALFRTQPVTPFIRPDEVSLADKAVRNAWIITTAASTLSRLERMRAALAGGTADKASVAALRHYRTTPEDLRMLALAARDALRQASRVEGGSLEAPDPATLLLSLVKAHSGPKGIAVDELIALCAPFGLGPGEVAKGVTRLLQDDECYQPSPGVIRLL